MSKASMARAIAKAGKKQEAQTRGLTGNRNAQGDFMTGENKLDTDRFAASEMMARDNTVDAVTPDLQNYIEDVKAQIDEIDSKIEAQERYLAPQDGETYNSEMGPEDHAELNDLYAMKDRILNDLETRLKEEGITIPPELQTLIGMDKAGPLQPVDNSGFDDVFDDVGIPY